MNKSNINKKRTKTIIKSWVNSRLLIDEYGMEVKEIIEYLGTTVAGKNLLINCKAFERIKNIGLKTCSRISL